MDKRFYELDSLRGIAAMTVVFHHFILVLPDIYDNENALWLLKHTPLHLFWSGHEAVIFFFLLSGFVLSLQFFDKAVYYPGFFIKRICRIYLPYIVTVIVAIVCSQIFYKGPNPNLSTWFNAFWGTKPTVSLMANYFALIIDFHNFRINTFDPALWSLVHEMRISLLFPLIMYLILRYGWKTNLTFVFFFTTGGMALHYIGRYKLNYMTNYYMTIHFIAMFMFGALLAKHRIYLIGKYQSISQRHRYLLLIVAILLYSFDWLFRQTLWPYNVGWLPDWFISAGVAIFIIAALGSDKISQVLLSRPIHYLGKISYSVYLYHGVILLCLVHWLYTIVPLVVIWIIGLIVTMVISAISFQYVEVPSINLGHFLSGRLKKVLPPKA